MNRSPLLFSVQCNLSYTMVVKPFDLVFNATLDARKIDNIIIENLYHPVWNDVINRLNVDLLNNPK